MESKQLIKKQGKVPFVEHMTLMNEKAVVLPKNAQVHDDLKRELVFYNLSLDSAKKGIEYLLQSKVKIGRPDDFFADMFKTDLQMKRIKNKLVSQEVRMKNFEEKKQRLENKRFEKAIKAYKMKQRHLEKKEHDEKIKKYKQQGNQGLDIDDLTKTQGK